MLVNPVSLMKKATMRAFTPQKLLISDVQTLLAIVAPSDESSKHRKVGSLTNLWISVSFFDFYTFN